jgi:phosphoribosylaminoimidazolecarboxamide formyltransferase/IMP cyclohydrolase
MTNKPTPVRRALLSVSDKAGIVDFAKALAEKGVELLSTGGTARTLKEEGLAVTDVATVTGFPEMLDGRVKTLHPKVHGGLLADRSKPEHVSALSEHGIPEIDLLAINLYPFEETLTRGAGFDECIENIDIGGPAMIRAAAKNHGSVTVLVDPADYAGVLDELGSGGVSAGTRQRLAAKAFSRTAAYDAAISRWFTDEVGESEPTWISFGGTLGESLRYGENPHQRAGFYRSADSRPGPTRPGVATARQLQG